MKFNWEIMELNDSAFKCQNFLKMMAMNECCCQKHQFYSFFTFLIFFSLLFTNFPPVVIGFFLLFDTTMEKKVMKIDHHRGPVVNVAISSTSQVLVSGSHDATICLWSLETYELLNLMQFNSPVLNFRLSPDSV